MTARIENRNTWVQPVKLAFRPTGIGDIAQHGEQVGECGVHGNRPWFRLPGFDRFTRIGALDQAEPLASCVELP